MMNEGVEQRITAMLQTIRIVWAAIFISMGILLSFALGALRRPEAGGGNQTIAFALYGLCAFLFCSSILMKRYRFRLARENQELMQVHTGMILAFALCEAAALFGVFVFVTTADPWWFVNFAIGGVGMIYHFPKRAQFEEAAYVRRF